MGLAASQGRYLCLTARNSDLIYEGQQISQQRMALAKETQEVATRYNDAMSNTVMNCVVQGQQAQRLTYDVLINSTVGEGLGMRIVDANGAVVIPGEYIDIKQYNEENNFTGKDKVTSTTEFIERYMPDLDDKTKTDFTFSSLVDVAKHFNEVYAKEHELKMEAVAISRFESDIVGNSQALTDAFITDPDYLQEMLVTGQYFIQKESSLQGKWEDYVWQGSNIISEEYDTSDDAAAESAYETAMVEIQKKDKLLEMRLEQVQTQQEAISKELESVKGIIDKNIEDSFKTFA